MIMIYQLRTRFRNELKEILEIQREKGYFTYRDVKHIIPHQSTLVRLRDSGVIKKIGVTGTNERPLIKYRVIDNGYLSNRRGRFAG